jgi:hypothetical protein
MIFTRPSRRALRLIFLGALLAGSLPAQEADGGPAIDFLYGERELFPSAMVSFTADSRYAPVDASQLGDPQGVISIVLKAPTDDCPVKVTFSETTFFEESHVFCRLPKAGTVYHVAPVMRYRAEKLAAQKQPLANLVIHAVVEMAGETTELSTKVVVHSVNDAIMLYRPRDDAGGSNDWRSDSKYMLAAYVNENNPWIDQRVTRHALDKGYVDAFAGYQRDKVAVRKEIKAVYDTLRDFGFKYTSFKEPSAAPVHKGENVRLQSIRLVGDSLESAQANGAETALIFASVFRKLSIDTVLFFLPKKRVLVGVYTETGRKRADSLLVFDPRKLGYEEFDAAVAAGAAAFDPVKEKLIFGEGEDQAALRHSQENFGYLAVDISLARENGILPIPEVRREFRGSGRDSAADRTHSP